MLRMHGTSFSALASPLACSGLRGRLRKSTPRAVKMGCTAGLSLFVLGVVLANSAQGILQVDVEGSEPQCFFEELRGGSTLSLA